MNSGCKILLHAMTKGRDLGMVYVLAKVLEHLGCRCLIVDNNNYTALQTRLWNPDAVFFVTLGRAERIKKAYPEAWLFLCSAEGSESAEHTNEIWPMKDKDLYDSVTRMYIWGRRVMDNVEKAIDALAEKNALHTPKVELLKKMLIVGNPRLDLVRYAKKRKRDDGKTQIGIIGNFSHLNHVNGWTFLRKIFNEVSFKEMDREYGSLRICMQVIQELDRGKYSFSVRPYPLESRSQYHESKIVKEGRVSVDDSLDFSTWMANQDVLIGAASSTTAQIGMAGKPLILLDKILDGRGELSEYFQEYLKGVKEANCPKSMEELFSMIENYESHPFSNPLLLKQLDYMHGMNMSGSAILRIATDMLSVLGRKDVGGKAGMPLWVVQAINKVRSTKMADNSYSRIYYDRDMEKLHQEFHPVIQSLVREYDSSVVRQ